MADAEQPRAARGPEPAQGGAPEDEDREAAARMMAETQQRLADDRQRMADAATPAEGGEPSDAQRQTVLDREDRAAAARADAVRGTRRAAMPVGTAYDDEREAAQQMVDLRRQERADELAERGIVDPAFDQQTAGYGPEHGPAPGDEPYGAFACAGCGGTIERSHPGYPDPEAATREIVCPHCGKRQAPRRGSSAQPKRRGGKAAGDSG